MHGRKEGKRVKIIDEQLFWRPKFTTGILLLWVFSFLQLTEHKVKNSMCNAMHCQEQDIKIIPKIGG